MTEIRRLAAIVSADVAGYSRLMGQDEAGTLAVLRQYRAELWQPKIAEHGGRIVGAAGDSLLTEFASVVAAVRCAIEIQQAMVERNAAVPEDRRLVLRIGVNQGEVIAADGTVYGEGVNLAARLQEIAVPGGICVSARVHDDVRDRVEATFADAGEPQLKNIARPVRVWRWSPAGAASPAPPPAAEAPLPLPDKPSIAVLPFANMSGDPEQGYFADGVAEDIITALSRFPSLFVIARNSSFSYRGKEIDIRQVGRELGVRYVLEGSVRKAGDRLRLTGQLVEAASGSHIWADRFDGLLDDVFDLQDRITARVAGAVERRVEQAEIRRAQTRSTRNLTAYDLSLRAHAAFHQSTEAGHAEALRLLDRAVAIDPRFSSAYGLMSLCHSDRNAAGWGSPQAAIAGALTAAKLAMETGQDDPNALAAAGMALAYLGGQPAQGLAQIERSLELNPNAVMAWQAAGWVNGWIGRYQRSIEAFECAMRLSPVDPMAYSRYAGMAYAYFHTGRCNEAIAWADRALAARPQFMPALRAKAAAAVMAGRPEVARQAVQELLAAKPELSIAAMAPNSPWQIAADRDQFYAALREAGLPE